jgi:hypothetical protein
MKRRISLSLLAAVLWLGACAQATDGPTAPSAQEPGGTVDITSTPLPGGQVPITLDGLAAQAIAVIAATKPDAARGYQAQVDALKAGIAAAEKAGDAAEAARQRESLKGVELSLVLSVFGTAVADQVIPAVDHALAELRTKLDSLQAAGRDVKEARALADSAAALLAKAKAQPAKERGGALIQATAAGALVEAARRAAGLSAGTPSTPGTPGTGPAPAPTPSGLWSTIETPRAWDYVPTPVSQSACAGQGTSYEVGPGLRYATPGQVPWLALKPCDNVNIHWQASPYRDVILLSNRGAANRYIRVAGVPGPAGQLPVLEGAGATASAGIPWLNPVLEGLGMIVVSPPKQYTYGYKPGYIEIANLEIRGASDRNSYVNGAGQTVAWQGFASGIYIERAENVAIRNCHVHDNGNGIFQNSKFDEAAQSRYLLVEGNYVHDNGRNGDAHEHNAYTEGVGTVYQFNRFGQPAAGSYGDNVKERSAGITFRYNYIEGGVDLIALRDPQSNAPFERTQRDAWGGLLVNSAYVYGNVLVMRERPEWKTGWGNTLVGFGDGDVSYGDVRGGTLFFYNNTVVSYHDFNPYADNPLFAVINSASNPVVQARNNVFLALPATPGSKPQPFAIFYHWGSAAFAGNWISAGYRNNDGHPSGGVMNPGQAWGGAGMGAVISNAQNDPGMVSPANGDFHLAAGSPLIDAGGALDPEVAKTHNLPVLEWVAATASRIRRADAKLDVGAFEF